MPCDSLFRSARADRAPIDAYNPTLWPIRGYRHHFLEEGMDKDEFGLALASCNEIIAKYEALKTTAQPSPRMKVV